MKKSILLIHIILALNLLFCSCVSNAPEIENNSNSFELLKDKDFDEYIKMHAGLIEVAQNEKMILSVDPLTAEFSILQKENGKIWFSNPQDRLNDPLASEYTQSLLSSQLLVEYFDKTNKKFVFNSFDNSVKNGNYSFAELEDGDGISILYELQDSKKNYIVPVLIEKSRFEKFISILNDEESLYIENRYNLITTEGASEEHRKVLLENYPSLVNHDLYALVGNMPDFVMEKLENYFNIAGYSEDDLITDNEMNFISNTLDNVKIKIPFDIRLENDSFTINIATRNIEMYGDVYFTKIEILPFLGAGGVLDEGYMLIPDGSGAIINFNNQKNQYQPISIPVYGDDLAIEKGYMQLNERQIHLPVFGIKNNNGGIVAYIENSDGHASINADISGRTHSYNHIFPSFDLLSYSNLSLPFGDFEPVNIFSEKYLDKDITVKYFVMGSDKYEYSDMALLLKNYFIKNGILSSGVEKDNKTMFEFIGAVDYKNTFLGIPYNSYKGLTKYKEMKLILEKLYETGIDDYVVKYSGWSNGGLNNKLNNRIDLMSVLGSGSDFENLLDYINSVEIKTYFDSEILTIGKNNLFDGFNKKSDTARSLTNDLAFRYEYDLATRERISDSGKHILSPKKIEKNIDELISSYKNSGLINISLGSAGNILYSDFKLDNNINRDETLDKIVFAIEKTTGNDMNLLIEGGNLYTLKDTERIVNSPFGSSGYYITDYDVPFYQMVTGESLNYHGNPLNLCADYNTEFLKILEYGGLPSFKWIYAPDYELKDTDYNFYSLNYENWIAAAYETDKILNEIFKDTTGRYIIKHNRISDGVYISSYGNNLDIITNYNNFTVKYKETSVPPESYQIIKEGES